METELGRIVDALPGLVWTALPDGQADFTNRRWCEYTGLSAEEAAGWGWLAAVHPEDKERLIGAWQAILDSGEAGELEARLRRSDGEHRSFLFRASPVADASGRIVKWCGINTDIEERKLADESWREQYFRFRQVVDCLPVHIIITNPDGRLEYANKQVLEYFGATLKELRDNPSQSTFHPDDRPGALAARKRSLESGEPFDFEGRHRDAGGIYRWFHMRGLALRDATGQVVLWYFALVDIDDRKRAEALLAGEKLLLEMVASNQPMSAVLETFCHLVESSSSGFYASVGLLDPSGTRIEHEAAPSLSPNFVSAINGAAVSIDADPATTAMFRGEQIIVHDLQSEKRWETSAWRSMISAFAFRSCWATPISSRDGKILGAFALYSQQPGTPTPQQQRVIEQFALVAGIAVYRAQSAAMLKRSEAFLAAAQHINRTGSWSWRVAADELTWSKETYSIYRFDPASPITFELIRSRVHPEDLPMMYEVIELARGDGNDFEYEHRLLMPDRSIKYLHVIGHGIRNQHGQLEYMGAVQDVTERRLSEEALGEARSELARVARLTSLGALTASIAHEVNQPLSGIITNASTCLRMLAADPPNVDGAQATARRTIRDGNRAADVIARLRALFMKADAASVQVDLNQTTREAVALSRSELQRSGVILQLDFAVDLPTVTGDRVQLQQVILNLVLNAAEAMSGIDDRPRRLVIRTKRCVDRVCLAVQDSGVGLDPKNMDSLFEAFYTTKSGGMGIGLSVSRTIIENHGGHLWAAPNLGPGATFSFSIPCRTESVVGADVSSVVSNS